MCPRISINPDLDLEKEIDHFMVLYYGPAAKAMRKYFNLIHADVRKRNFEQAVDTIVRGFITKELAAKAYACFREAERLTANSPVFAERVGLEKIYLLWSDLTDNNRANGRIDHSELKEYAEKLAEFCRLNKVNRLGEIWGNPTYKWLWEAAVLKIGQKCPFYNDPVIVQLMKEPFAALQNSIPRVQEKKEYGIFIPASGVFGGYKSNSNWLRAKTVDAVQLRRASSGYGFAQVLLILEGKPQKDVIMRIEGIDNEKKTDAFMEISVNGKVVFKGKNPWKKEKWSDADFLLPADVLQKGENTVTLKNITPDTEKDEFIGDQFRTKRNYFWGWFMFTGIKLILPKDGGTDKK